MTEAPSSVGRVYTAARFKIRLAMQRIEAANHLLLRHDFRTELRGAIGLGGPVKARCRSLTRLAAVAGVLAAASPHLGATTYTSVVISPGFSGPVTLAFDYIDGGPPDNTVVLNALGGNWVPASAAPTDFPQGSICGADSACPPPWTFTESAPPNSFYELDVPFDAIGTTLIFSFTTTDNAPDAASFPDSFSFFLLDPDTGLPLFPTSDPVVGEDALFLLSIGGSGPCGESLCVYPPDPTIEGFRIDVAPVTAAPEPGTLALLAAGFGAIFARRRLS